MFLIFLFLAIYIVFIYLVFKILTETSSYFLLVDEYFMDKINKSTDSLLQNFKNNSKSDKKESSYNRYLRYDFFITLLLGIVWFLFPKLLFNFTHQELFSLPGDFKYLGQSLAILTLLTCIIPVKTLKKEDKDKKLVLGTKLFCAVMIVVIQLIYVYYFPRFHMYNLISIILLSIWSANSLQGLIHKPLFTKNKNFD